MKSFNTFFYIGRHPELKTKYKTIVDLPELTFIWLTLRRVIIINSTLVATDEMRGMLVMHSTLANKHFGLSLIPKKGSEVMDK
jgi:hypothetical protein